MNGSVRRKGSPASSGRRETAEGDEQTAPRASRTRVRQCDCLTAFRRGEPLCGGFSWAALPARPRLRATIRPRRTYARWQKVTLCITSVQNPPAVRRVAAIGSPRRRIRSARLRVRNSAGSAVWSPFTADPVDGSRRPSVLRETCNEDFLSALVLRSDVVPRVLADYARRGDGAVSAKRSWGGGAPGRPFGARHGEAQTA
jgi:hypothetical protein